MKLRAWTSKTLAGTFSLVSDGDSVLAAGFTDDVRGLVAGIPGAEKVKTVKSIRGTTDAIEAYFDGELTALDRISIAPVGSERKLTAWEAMRKVPPGSISYREYADYIPPPASARSAARACATNPIALIVPCHRMIRSDGSLGGYGWGLDYKIRLLEHEDRFK